MFLKTFFCSLLTLSCLAVHADNYFEAAQVCTMQGQTEAANRYQQMDFTRFVAGNIGLNLTYENAGNATMKGFAYFDLDQDGLREALKLKDGEHVLFSFMLQQVVGKPRELRVEFIGTIKDKDSDKSRAQQFQANPLRQANNVLQQGAEPGLKVIDATSIVEHDLSKRWLVIRFEQDGYRIEDGQNDLYQFNANNSSVRLTVTSNKKQIDAVENHYQADGLGGILPDMNTNILPDMSQKPEPSMDKSITPDMSSDLTPDMNQQNILPDMDTQNIIQDQNNQQ